MPTDGSTLLDGFLFVDEECARQPGGHATSEAWRSTLERFWMSGKRRLVVRKGRQGGGSTTMARVAVVTALFGEHVVSPGTRLHIPFVSISLKESRERLHNIRATLDAIGEPYTSRDDAIELSKRPIVFGLFSCSARFSVGMTSIALVEDEAARWWSDEQSANPAVEVDASLTPSLATQPNGRIYTFSSPLGQEDFHAELIARGETQEQCIAEGPSWYWNPSISEADTHSLQPDDIRWRREFCAIPQHAAVGALNPEDVQAAYRYVKPGEPIGPTVLSMDSSMGRGDSWAWLAACWHVPTVQFEDVFEVERIDANSYVVIEAAPGIPKRRKDAPPAPKPELYVHSVGAFEGQFAQQLSSDEVVEAIAGVAHRNGASTIYCDQYQAYTLASAFKRHRLTLSSHAWTNPSKVETLTRIRTWLRDRTLAIEPSVEGAKLIDEMLTLDEVILPSGAISISARKKKNDDRWACLANLAAADAVGGLRGSQNSNHGRLCIG
ncbi:MAG: hypothetical protein ABTD50_19390 [Polyangiaceae bacterium]|jgi:hypothetical protein